MTKRKNFFKKVFYVETNNERLMIEILTIVVNSNITFKDIRDFSDDYFKFLIQVEPEMESKILELFQKYGIEENG